ncbi:hypothetical protein CDV31_009258 [Fusarium ambrosium]|uniref:F-box domain-containing protein n=1 Tax=Fusarium ambrosium TaxID=131363 RepID=A0A428TVS5_9HYPO|nr:hypothetical protein CDV31_009258 [Fusarium ambrosium]
MREACYLGNGLYTYNTGNKLVRQYACLTLDYGGAQQFMGNQWKVIRGEEHYVVSPLRDRALRRWYDYLEAEPSQVNGRVIQPPPSSRDDPFVKLPPELVLLIMESMPMADFLIEWTRNLEFKAIKAGNCGFVCKENMDLDLEHQVFFPENGWLAGVSIRIFHDQPDDDEEEDLFPEQTIITGVYFPFSQPPVGGHADFGDPDGHATHRLAPRSGYFIVGLKVYDDEGGRITGIELIQQPLAKLRGPTRRAMVDMVSAGIWSVENTKEKYWIGDDEEW